MKARALFSAELLCAKQGKPEGQWMGRTGGRQVPAAWGVFSVCCDVPSCMLSVSGGSTQHLRQFCLWDLSGGTGSPMSLRSHLSKSLPTLFVCPWHYCQRPVPCHSVDACSWQCLSAILAAALSSSSGKAVEEELSYCRGWEMRKDFLVSLWFFVKEMWYRSCLAVRLCMSPAFHPPFNSVNAQCWA